MNCDVEGDHGAVSVKSRIEEKLEAALQPASLRVVDESHLHAGHAGHRPEGETHFRVYVVAAGFEGKSRIERHRLVNTLLADELAGPVHALAVHPSAPGEADRGD
jgi:BolA protein